MHDPNPFRPKNNDFQVWKLLGSGILIAIIVFLGAFFSEVDIFISLGMAVVAGIVGAVVVYKV
ncbi:MAG: hypothetical protein SFW35_04450 [Chitinophagales bacterium]|nr:hypothetical protein [Chitinophagales bacterium]